MKVKNQDLFDLFTETLSWINLCPDIYKLIQAANIWLPWTNRVFSVGMLWCMQILPNTRR